MNVFLDSYNKKYNENIHYEDVDNWFFFDHNRFEEIYPDTVKRIDEYVFLHDELHESLFDLNKDHAVYILTHQENSEEKLKEKLKQAHIREVAEYSKLIKQDRFTGDKLKYNFDIFIDDCPLLVEKMKDHPKKILLLYDQPWNWYLDVSKLHNVYRVKNWEEIMKKIEELEDAMCI